MSRTVTATMTAWASQYCPHTPEDYYAKVGAELLQNLLFDKADSKGFGSGYSLVGTAEVTLTIADPDDLIANKVAALKAEKAQTLADAEAKATRIERQIQQLLAITHEGAV